MQALLIGNLIWIAALPLIPLGILIRRLVDGARLAAYERELARKHGLTKKSNKKGDKK